MHTLVIQKNNFWPLSVQLLSTAMLRVLFLERMCICQVMCVKIYES